MCDTQVSKGARVQDAATGGVAAAVMAEEEEGTGVLMLTLALVTTTKVFYTRTDRCTDRQTHLSTKNEPVGVPCVGTADCVTTVATR